MKTHKPTHAALCGFLHDNRWKLNLKANSFNGRPNTAEFASYEYVDLMSL